MPHIELVGVSKNNCRGLNLAIERGELFVIVGATGAGKTTVLNVIAGLGEYSGSVFIGGRYVNGLTTPKRGVGYLFQDVSLFPNLTVEMNISFGLRAQGCDKAQAKARVSVLMEMMRIEHLAGRYPCKLSGGEKKRVALARALAPSPGIILLDEPSSNLDTQTARHLRRELRGLLKALGTTTVLVTHDLREAEELADRIAFMSNGDIRQICQPAEFFSGTTDVLIAEFLGIPYHFDKEDHEDERITVLSGGNHSPVGTC